MYSGTMAPRKEQVRLKANDGFVLVKLDDAPTETAGGIHLVDAVRDENKVQEGVITDVGRGMGHWLTADRKFVYEQPIFVIGDRVHFNSWGGEKIEDGDDTVAVLRHAEVLAIA
jgi:co-chaperonin GroES (HSP10)